MIEVKAADDLANMNNSKARDYILKNDIDLDNYGM